ncbi:odorant receptor 49a-like [Teleopsis dalmanni]|uniref:odorant receptor 49a-like n=1 Tax=Teleopsis dalmanni TaxID=139649 RepID=UPI0018CFBE73|nr:odorant receptor 49a-like [Teleopsis dalmanni]
MDFVEKLFWTPNFIYKMVGYDFLQTRKPKRIKYIMNTFIFCAVICHFFCKYIMFKYMFEKARALEILSALRIAIFASYAVDSNIKFLAFIINRKRMRKIHFILSKIYPKSQEEQNIYAVYENNRSPIIRVTLQIFYISCFLVIIGPIIETACKFLYQLVTLGFSNASLDYSKPMPMEYDFDFRSAALYLPIYAIEALNVHFTTVTNIGTDLWLISYVMQVCMHLKFICRMLEKYEPERNNEKMDCAFLGSLIKKHQLMLYISNQLKDIFGISLAFNLISTTTVLCGIAGYLSITLDLSLEFCFLIGFLLTVSAQFFLVCFYGQQLKDLSEQIALAAYKNAWYNGSKAYNNMIWIIMMRAQKPAELYAKGFQSICLDTFKTSMGMTYRVFALLRHLLK